MTTEIQIGDIPQSLLENIESRLRHYFVPLLALSEQSLEFKPIGSGTLVMIDGSHFILTAAHVWEESKHAEKIHLVLTDNPQTSGFAIPRDYMSPRTLWDGQCCEWGPDLALLEIPQSHASTIKAKQSFLNLALQKDDFAAHPPNTDTGFWTVLGMVGEYSHVDTCPEPETVTAHIEGCAFFSGVDQTHHRQNYDYLDVAAKTDLAGVPLSFGGISGGGLWQVRVTKDKSGTISWDGKRRFRGVAFWQSPVAGNRRTIRCHGPRSIFEMAWSEWGLP